MYMYLDFLKRNMTILNGGVSNCSYCRFYTPVGRRGGFCSQLDVPVQSRWEACSLGRSPFQTTYELEEEIDIPQYASSVIPMSVPKAVSRSA